MPEPSDPARHAVEAALLSRRSVRGFLPRPVPRDVLGRLLELAARAPSGTNIQPWGVHVVTGESLRQLSAALLAAHDSDAPREPDYVYYPETWRDPYLSRRRKLGWDLYGLLGIGRGDKAAMHAQHGRNYAFFGAPVGLIFTLEREMGSGAFLDLGMFMQGLMIAARAYDLDTCPQGAFVAFPQLIRDHLGLPSTDMVVCGMALGYADPADPANALVTGREDVASFTRFHGTWPAQTGSTQTGPTQTGPTRTGPA